MGGTPSAGGGGLNAAGHTPAWQQEDNVISFAARRRVLISMLDVQEDILSQVLTRGERPVQRFLDFKWPA